MLFDTSQYSSGPSALMSEDNQLNGEDYVSFEG
jgi:hypothetical protein